MLTDANIVTKNGEFEEEEAEMEVSQWRIDIRMTPKSHLRALSYSSVFLILFILF